MVKKTVQFSATNILYSPVSIAWCLYLIFATLAVRGDTAAA